MSGPLPGAYRFGRSRRFRSAASCLRRSTPRIARTASAASSKPASNGIGARRQILLQNISHLPRMLDEELYHASSGMVPAGARLGSPFLPGTVTFHDNSKLS